MKIFIKILAFFIIICFTSILYPQGFSTPRPSPVASVMQTVGITDVTINYSRPGVKGRVIWGELVPYNEIWRTGANEVTSITFSDPVKINGTELPAGTYGIHTIPTQKDWTIIFSKNTQVGGSSQFNKENEALRIIVTPEPSEFNERMLFTFTEVTDNSSMVNLFWEKLKLSFKLETDTEKLVLAKAEQSVDWQTPLQAATYCLNSNTELDKAMKWINASTTINENYWNLRIKARLLEKTGNKQEAISVMEKAIAKGKEMENRPFDYEQMEKLLSDWKG